jgi:cephalosporin-C deacetylase-like acetyl esterase
MGNPYSYLRERLAAIQPTAAWTPDRPRDWETTTRKRLSALIGCVDEPWEMPTYEIETETKEADHLRLGITFPSRAGWDARGWLLLPHEISEPSPGVVCLPGHGRGADALVGMIEEPYQQNFALQCVRRGWVTLAVEQVSFGRNQSSGTEAKGSSCLLDSMMSFSLGETMVGWRVRDAIAAVRLLASHPYVDSMRIGTLGISGGGLTSLWTSALEPLVYIAGVSGYFTPMSHSIHMVDHCPDNYVPGLAHVLDIPDLAGLVYPRWLATENGTLDPIFHIDGYRMACGKARQIFEDCPEQFSAHEFEGDHEFRGESIFEAFQRAFE